MKKQARNNGIQTILIPTILLISVVFWVGCKSNPSGSSFSMPSFKSSQQKPKKDPGTPTSVEEWLVQPRNDF